jgi:opacity protein-like surface antigen
MAGAASSFKNSFAIAAKGARKGWYGGAAVMALLAGSSGALAQDCTRLLVGPFTLETIAGVAAGTASAVAGSLGNVSTAFLTNQTSAFVAGSTATMPNQTSGGAWARAVGGVVETKSETSVAGVLTNDITGEAFSGNSNCISKVRQNYWGFQAGRDISILNWNEWNVHIGATVGYLEARGDDLPGLSNPGAIKDHFQVPFFGSYLVATRGGFFSDVMVKREYYNVGLDQPLLNLHSQTFGARAWSVSAGAGYNHGLGDGYFFEPSVGFIWSRTEVDAIGLVGAPGINGIPGTLQVDDIDSKIGRATLRAGRNFTDNGMAWQPFGSVSVFHEFAGDVTSSFTTCTGCAVIGVEPVTATIATSTSRVGTLTQFSAGVAGQAIDTGWVGFVRGDYRLGEKIEGWAASAGLRYNFMPERHAAMPMGKLAVKAPPPLLPYIWSGFYLGGHFGVVQGRGHVGFYDPAGTSVDPHVGGYLGGFQAGYNIQYGAIVLGAEVEISRTNANGAQTCGSDPGFDLVDGLAVNFRFTSLFLNCETSLDWIGTAAGRLGIVSWWSDRTLFFVKGGAAWTHENVNIRCNVGFNNDPTSIKSCRNPAGVITSGFYGEKNRVGGMIGAGAEFGLTRNWSAKAEWSYIRFQDRDVTATDGTLINLGASITQAKVGVNYRFDAAPLPVAAKY